MALAVMLFGMSFIVSSGNQVADAGVNQGQVVPEAPRRDVPVVLDGRVIAHAQVGDRIFVGGDFQQVEQIDGTIITQPFLFAYNINTGLVDPNFRPVLNKLVRSLAPTQAGDGLYVGGLFSAWDNSFPLRIAKLDAQGNLDVNFGPRASAKVQSIVEIGDSVYLGGDFTAVSGVAASGLIKVDRITGAVDTSFVPMFEDSISGNSIVKTIVASPDGSALFVLHYGATIDGQVREAVAKFDLGGVSPTLSGWNVPWSAQQGDALCWRGLRDLAISPDGSFLVVGGQGADRPPNCDSILRYSTAGASTVNFDWSARMYSSVFSLAVSDVAIYAGGHFCAAPKNPIAPGGVSSDYPNSINGCNINDASDSANPSVRDPDNAVFRKQIAALDPTTGQALPWDPGSNSQVAVYDLTLIDRGLLAGHDSNRFNGFLVGRSGFFDFGVAPDTTPPSILVTEPSPNTVIADPTTLAGTAADNFGVTEVTIRLRNVMTDEWLQLDGTLGETQVDLPVTTFTIGLGEVAWTTPLQNLPPGSYEVRGFSRDAAGNTSEGLASPFTVPGTAACSVALDAQDQPVISWTEFEANGATSVFIRRNGGYLDEGVAGSSSFTDTTAAPGDYSYLVRWRPGGVLTDVDCTPATITVPQGGGGITCSVGLDEMSQPILNWTAVPGIARYSVREGGVRFLALVENGTTYTDTTATPGDYSYQIRYRQNGVVIDLNCQPDPITVPDPPAAVCTGFVNANGEVVLDWDDIPGEDSYVVRDTNTYITTVLNQSDFVHLDPTSGDRTYVIRYRMAGQVFDITCAPDPIVVP